MPTKSRKSEQYIAERARKNEEAFPLHVDDEDGADHEGREQEIQEHVHTLVGRSEGPLTEDQKLFTLMLSWE